MKTIPSFATMMKYTAVLLSGFFFASSAIPSASGQTNLGTLADELADRDNLALFPEQLYRQGQVSSHDTRNARGFSRLGAPWGSVNVDFGNFLRTVEIQGRTELVLMADEGPGVITRWWTTGIDQKLLDKHHFRIYIDGAKEPTITATAEDLVGGNNSGFGDSLNFETPELGGNLYAPIPYRESILITWDGPMTHGHPHVALRDPSLKNSIDNALWYNINYRRLPQGTDVKSYTPEDIQAFQQNLDRVNKNLRQLEPTGSINDQRKAQQSLADGKSLALKFQGPGAIRRIQTRVTGEDQLAALADSYLVLLFDGQQTARIPIGEFFGNGYSAKQDKPYNAGADYLRRVAEDGSMVSLWVMPYQKSAEVRVENASGQQIDVAMEVGAGKWTWNERSMYFHADYVSEPNIYTRQKPGGPWPGDAGKRHLYSAEGDGDFRFLDIRGKGVFVGDTMSIRNKSTGNGLNSWWGEGDEKIYIDYLDADGDGSNGKPLHLGTGTEDYYGYSFGSGKEFATPFITMPIAAGNRADNGSLTVQGRVRGLDAIAFEQSLKFDMEIWKWRKGELDFAAATFWYGLPGAVSLHPVADLADDFGQPQPSTDSAGDGHWSYLSSTHADPHAQGATTAKLTWGKVGARGVEGYGGDNADNLPAIAKSFLTDSGSQNIGINGEPGYHEVAFHPGGGDDAKHPYAVARWTAGDSTDGLVNISGSVRNLVADAGDSVDFYIYVDGQLAYKATNTDQQSHLPEAAFDFDRTVKAGQHVDFVVGNGGNGDSSGDESVVRAIIRSASPSIE